MLLKEKEKKSKTVNQRRKGQKTRVTFPPSPNSCVEKGGPVLVGGEKGGKKGVEGVE